MRRLSNSRLFELCRKATAPPPGGYRAETFTPQVRRRVQADMLRIRRLIMLRMSRELTIVLNRVLTPVPYEVADRFDEKLGRLGKAIVELDFGGENLLWAEAIEEVMAEFGHELEIEMGPRIQSALDESFNKNSITIGAVIDERRVAPIRLRRSRELAQQITRINQTTKDRLNATFNRAQERGLTSREISTIIREKAPSIAANRIPTIIRTEMGRAADAGTALAMEESGIVSYVDVVGCRAIEPGIPTYNGYPTCNITNVPVGDASSLRFHIAHTGVIVASHFISYDGTVEPQKTGNVQPDQ